VSWFEIKPWVCAIPPDGDTDPLQYTTAESQLSDLTIRSESDFLSQYNNQTVSLLVCVLALIVLATRNSSNTKI